MTHRHYFAPGVIEGPHRAQPRWPAFRLLDWLAQGVLRRAWLLVAMSLVLGLVTGYLGLLP